MAIPAPGAPAGPSKASPAGGQQAPKKYYAQTMTPLGVSTADVGAPTISGMPGGPWTPPGGGLGGGKADDPTGGGALETVSSALTDAAAQAQAPGFTGTEDFMQMAMGRGGLENLAGEYGGGYYDPIQAELEGLQSEEEVRGEFGQTLARDLSEIEGQKSKALREVRASAIMSGAGFGRIADVTGERSRYAGIRADAKMQSDENLKTALDGMEGRRRQLSVDQDKANSTRTTELVGYGTAHLAKHSLGWGEGTVVNPMAMKDIETLANLLAINDVATDVADAMIGDLVEHWKQSGFLAARQMSNGWHYQDLGAGSASYIKNWAGDGGLMSPGMDVSYKMLGGAAHITEDWAGDTIGGWYQTETGEPIQW